MTTFFAKDGVIVPEATLSLLDHGVLLGDGLYETLRIADGCLAFFEDHYERLVRGAQLLSLALPSREDIFHGIRRLFLSSGYGDARVRLTLTRGEGHPGLSTQDTQSHWFLTLSPLPPTPEKITAVFYDGERPLPEVKSLNALTQVLAYRFAESKGAKEALMVTRDGKVTEGTYSNFFYFSQGTYYTPSLHMLPGVTRKQVLALLHENHSPVEEIPTVTKAMLLSAEYVFLTSTLLGIVPVTQIEEHTFSPSPLFSQLQKQFFHVRQRKGLSLT